MGAINSSMMSLNDHGVKLALLNHERIGNEGEVDRRMRGEDDVERGKADWFESPSHTITNLPEKKRLGSRELFKPQQDLDQIQVLRDLKKSGTGLAIWSPSEHFMHKSTRIIVGIGKQFNINNIMMKNIQRTPFS
jgi:hypothetical protein